MAMKRWSWALGSAILIAGGAFLVWQARSAPPAAAKAQQPDARAAAPAGIVGTSSCSGSACHGGNGGYGKLYSEYTTWITFDPHAKAYTVLLTDPRSKVMEKNLRGLDDVKSAHPEKDVLCLKCHGRVMEAHLDKPTDRIEEGFGCESCHGAAKKWLGPHTAKSWKKLSDETKLKEYGMQPMLTIRDRAAVCAQCHVGDGSQEVNHDLIAAGHPRLNFEYSAYLANLPKHWQKDKDRFQDIDDGDRPWTSGAADNKIKVWTIGQTESARAALDLLKVRAADKAKPWPEFAEYDCFACHHDLRQPSRRQNKAHYKGRVPGSIPWADWYYTMPRGLAGDMKKADIKKVLDDLNKEMNKPLPDRQKVVALASQASQKMRELAASLEKFDSRTLWMGWEAAASEKVRNWDEAAQTAFGVAAILQGRKRLPEVPGMQELIAKLIEVVQFSRKPGPPVYDSPKDLDLEKFNKALSDVVKYLVALSKDSKNDPAMKALSTLGKQQK